MKNEKITIIEHRGKKIELNEKALDKLYELKFGYNINHIESNEGIKENLGYLHSLYDFFTLVLENGDVRKNELHSQMSSLYYLGQFFRAFE